jgi:hypothetical protein
MPLAVRVRATVTGHRRRGVAEHELALPLAPGPVSVRKLIEATVSAEVAAYAARAEEASLVRVLTEKSLAEELSRGAVRMGDIAAPEAVDLRAAVDAALTAFDDGIFKIFVADEEADGSSDVQLSDGTNLLFLRLVPLAGG